jgi:hypothetical protein
LRNASRQSLNRTGGQSRSFSAQAGKDPLKARLQELIPKKSAEIAEVKKKWGDQTLGTCTVSQVFTASLYDPLVTHPHFRLMEE